MKGQILGNNAAMPSGRWIEKSDRFKPECYLDAANRARKQKNSILAHTMFRCAQYLGASFDTRDLEPTRLTEEQLQGQISIYQRNKRVAELLFENFGDADLEVVDVGGHTGILSQMMPRTRYFLCEPVINNTQAVDLANAGYMFDVALSVHVFEHIPDDLKYSFFETLLSISRKGVILCNPVDTGDAVERQEFLLDVYGPLSWIVEHLECGTPSLEVFRGIAEHYNLELTIVPNGNRFISMTLFAMQHFAKATNDPEMMRKNGKIARYVNRHYKHQNSDDFPRDYAFVFKKK